MDMYGSYKSPFGYESGVNGGVDSYGVDHSGFSTQDELQYQTARAEKEKKLAENLQRQGVAESSFPQYGTNFWGNSANNYGFGVRNIAQNAQNILKNFSNCYMNFDGQNLGLYNNKGLVDSLDAQSGRDDYQSSIYQNVVNKGPIPEGTYYANQNQRQNLTFKNIALKLGEKLGINTTEKSSWSGNPVSWGTRRVWLQPDSNTNTYGRSGFTIHGGLSKGSAGCIDIPWQTGKLSDYLDNCQDSVPVNVKYPKGW